LHDINNTVTKFKLIGTFLEYDSVLLESNNNFHFLCHDLTRTGGLASWGSLIFLSDNVNRSAGHHQIGGLS
jgi:hypothetical protein